MVRFGAMYFLLSTLSPAALAAAVVDDVPTGAATVHRLSPDAIEAALADGAARNRAAEALAALPSIDTDRKIHGEVGVGMGSNGGREAFGTAAVPVGENGSAVMSYDYSRQNYPQNYSRRDR